MRLEAFREPFRHWIIDGLLNAADLGAAYRAVPAADWPGWEARYENDCEQGKRTARDFPEIPAVAALLTQLANAARVDSLRRLTGVAGLSADPRLYGAGLHVTEPGGWLNCHLDYALHESGLERRVNLILFLNPTWKEEWGGAFELWDAAARNVVKRVYPACNRAVVWESSDLAYHGTQATSADAPPRVTAAGYFLAPPRPGCVRRRALFAPRRDGREGR